LENGQPARCLIPAKTSSSDKHSKKELRRLILTEDKLAEIVQRLSDSVVEFEEDEVVAAANEAAELGLDAYTCVMDGLAGGMKIVGDLYEQHEYFVPEVLMCADALYAGLNILRPLIRTEDMQAKLKGQVVIGVVQGDVHDIGKNLVKMMFDVGGFTVHDLGCDVPLEQFVEEQLRTDSNIVAVSAMMTTTMMGMRKVIKMIKEKNPNVLIMLGGAPLTREVTDLFGADGYAENASNAVQEAIKMIGRLKTIEEEMKALQAE
jgi:corrinoid protein of di/trimethylamine methyltransferase